MFGARDELYSSLFFAVVSAFALDDFFALRFVLAVLVLDFDALAADFEAAGFAAFAIAFVVSFLPCWAACACSCGATASIRATAAAAMLRRFILPPNGWVGSTRGGAA